MRISQLEVPGASVALDLCKLCYFVWFDPGELEAVDSLKKEHPDVFRHGSDTEQFREAAKLAFGFHPELHTHQVPEERLSQALETTGLVADLVDLLDLLPDDFG